MELHLSKKEAKRLVSKLSDLAVCDATVAKICDSLSRQISEDDARLAELPPWKEVTYTVWSGIGFYEVLECGHHRSLRQANLKGRFIENGAKKRRCYECAGKEWPL